MGSGKSKPATKGGNTDGDGGNHGWRNGGRDGDSSQGWGIDVRGEVSLLVLTFHLLIFCSCCRDSPVLMFSISFWKIINLVVVLRVLGCIVAPFPLCFH